MYWGRSQHSAPRGSKQDRTLQQSTAKSYRFRPGKRNHLSNIPYRRSLVALVPVHTSRVIRLTIAFAPCLNCTSEASDDWIQDASCSLFYVWHNYFRPHLLMGTTV